MHLVKLLTTLTLFLSLAAAEETTTIESQAAEPSSASGEWRGHSLDILLSFLKTADPVLTSYSFTERIRRRPAASY